MYVCVDQGKLLFRSPRERFFQFLWRPRPPSLIEPAKEKEIAKSLKKYSKQFDEEDELLKSGKDREVLAERRSILEEWKNWYECPFPLYVCLRFSLLN